MPPSFPFYHSSLQQTITTMASHHVPLNVVGYTTTPPKHSTFLITVTVLAVTVTVTVFLALYFLLRHLHCSCLRSVSPSSAVTAATFSSSPRISPVISTNTTYSAVDSLPLFTFSSITRRSSGGVGGDCAVCLSKFEQCDLLRLLPLCCHAFHAECIDTWLRSNHTCPLCRSTVFASESDVMKILWSPAIYAGAGNSFRLEIGNISDREGDGETRRARMTSSRSYSLGSFEYLVDEEAEITLSDAHRRNVSGEKDDVAAAESTAVSEPSPAGDLASGRSWLKDYVDQLSASISTMSFRSSGRFFTGSSRRSDDVVFAGGDYEVGLETNRLGEEISEMFRWLSGV